MATQPTDPEQRRNLALVRAGIDAFNRRDARALAALSSANLEIRMGGALAVPVSYRGRAGIADYFQEQDDHWAYISFEVEEIHALGNRVLVIGTQAARGRASGITVRSHEAVLVTIEAGRATAIQSFRGPGEAVVAAPLAA